MKNGQFAKVQEISIKRLRKAAKVPMYAHTGEYGDLAADLYSVEKTLIHPWSTVTVPTGIALEFPAGIGGIIEDRSGAAVKGITTLAGVIDPGYRGEIKVVIANLADNLVSIDAGERIAQLRLVNLIQARFLEVEELGLTRRGKKGFGSTGK